MLDIFKIGPGVNVPKMLTVLFFGTFMSGVLLAKSSIDFPAFLNAGLREFYLSRIPY